eukprot:Nk52_evm29s967 gene=Nk52_evmTU29s967
MKSFFKKKRSFSSKGKGKGGGKGGTSQYSQAELDLMQGKVPEEVYQGSKGKGGGKQTSAQQPEVLPWQKTSKTSNQAVQQQKKSQPVEQPVSRESSLPDTTVSLGKGSVSSPGGDTSASTDGVAKKPGESIGNVDYTVLHKAIKDNNVDQVKESSNLKTVDVTDWEGFSSLHHACKVGNAQIVRILLNSGATSKMNKDGKSPATVAIEEQNISCLKELIDGQADLTLADNKGNTPLHHAVMTNNSQAVAMLLEAEDCAANEKNQDGFSALMTAVRGKNTTIAELLASHEGIEINCHDSRDRTPLMFAASSGAEGLVKLFLQKGANPNIKDDTDWTAFDYADNYGYDNCAKLLPSTYSDDSNSDQDEANDINEKNAIDLERKGNSKKEAQSPLPVAYHASKLKDEPDVAKSVVAKEQNVEIEKGSTGDESSWDSTDDERDDSEDPDRGLSFHSVEDRDTKEGSKIAQKEEPGHGATLSVPSTSAKKSLPTASSYDASNEKEALKVPEGFEFAVESAKSGSDESEGSVDFSEGADDIWEGLGLSGANNSTPGKQATTVPQIADSGQAQVQKQTDTVSSVQSEEVVQSPVMSKSTVQATVNPPEEESDWDSSESEHDEEPSEKVILPNQGDENPPEMAETKDKSEINTATAKAVGAEGKQGQAELEDGSQSSDWDSSEDESDLREEPDNNIINNAQDENVEDLVTTKATKDVMERDKEPEVQEKVTAGGETKEENTLNSSKSSSESASESDIERESVGEKEEENDVKDENYKDNGSESGDKANDDILKQEENLQGLRHVSKEVDSDDKQKASTHKEFQEPEKHDEEAKQSAEENSFSESDREDSGDLKIHFHKYTSHSNSHDSIASEKQSRGSHIISGNEEDQSETQSSKDKHVVREAIELEKQYQDSTNSNVLDGSERKTSVIHEDSDSLAGIDPIVMEPRVEVDNTANTYRKLEAEKKALEKSCQSLEASVSALEYSKMDLEEKNHSLNKELDSQEGRINALEDKVQEFDELITTLKAKVASEVDAREAAEMIKKQLELEVEDITKVVEEQDQTISDLKDELKQERETKEFIKESISKQHASTEEAVNSEISRSSANSENELKDLKLLQQELISMKSELESQSNNYLKEKEESSKEILSLKSELATLEAELESKKDQIDELGVELKEKNDEHKTALDGIEAELAKSKSEVSELRILASNETGKTVAKVEELGVFQRENDKLLKEIKSVENAVKDKEATMDKERILLNSKIEKLEQELEYAKEEKKKYEAKWERETEAVKELQKKNTEMTMNLDRLKLEQFTWEEKVKHLEANYTQYSEQTQKEREELQTSIEKYSEKQETMVPSKDMEDIIKLLKDEFKNEREMWNREKEQLQASLKGVQEELSSTKLMYESIKSEKEKSNVQFNELSKEHASLRGKWEVEEKRNAELQSAKLLVEQNFANLKEKELELRQKLIQEENEKRSLEKRIEDKEQLMTEVRNQSTSTTASEAQLKAEIKSLTECLSQTTMAKEAFENDAKESNRLWEMEVNSRSKVGAKLMQLEKLLMKAKQRIESEKAKCQKAETKVEMMQMEMELLAQKLQDIEEEMDEKNALLKFAKGEISNRQSQNEKSACEVKDTISSLQAEYMEDKATLEVNISVLKRENENLKSQLKREVKSRAKMESLANDLTREINSLKTQYSLLNAARNTGGSVSIPAYGNASITFATEEELRNIKQRYEEKCKSEIKKFKSEFEGKMKEDVNSRLRELNEQLEEQQRARENLSRIRDENEHRMRTEFDATLRTVKIQLEATQRELTFEQANKKPLQAELIKLRTMWHEEMKMRKKLEHKLSKSIQKAEKLIAALDDEKKKVFDLLDNNRALNGRLESMAYDLHSANDQSFRDPSNGPLFFSRIQPPGSSIFGSQSYLARPSSAGPTHAFGSSASLISAPHRQHSNDQYLNSIRKTYM